MWVIVCLHAYICVCVCEHTQAEKSVLPVCGSLCVCIPTYVCVWEHTQAKKTKQKNKQVCSQACVSLCVCIPTLCVCVCGHTSSLSWISKQWIRMMSEYSTVLLPMINLLVCSDPGFSVIYRHWSLIWVSVSLSTDTDLWPRFQCRL